MTIRSFVCRGGRITPAQQRAWLTLWPQYGIESNSIINLDALFGRSAPKHLEIGFGRGDALINMAKAHPEQDYLGVEVHRPGIGCLLLKIEAAQLTNVRILCGNVIDLLPRLPAHSLDVVYILFPDPWPKKRHHKRRLIQPGLLDLLAQKMKSGGYLYLATDWLDYATHMLQTLEATSPWVNGYRAGHFAPRPEDRPLTKFEQRGQQLGHQIWDLLYRCQKD